MEFLQIIEVRASKIDEMRALDEQWEKATVGRRTARRSIVLAAKWPSSPTGSAVGAADLR